MKLDKYLTEDNTSDVEGHIDEVISWLKDMKYALSKGDKGRRLVQRTFDNAMKNIDVLKSFVKTL